MNRVVETISKCLDVFYFFKMAWYPNAFVISSTILQMLSKCVFLSFPSLINKPKARRATNL